MMTRDQAREIVANAATAITPEQKKRLIEAMKLLATLQPPAVP